MSEPIEVVTVKTENDLTEEGLYYVEPTDQLVLMMWDGNQLRKSGFVQRQALVDMGVSEQDFLGQWLKDSGYLDPADESEASNTGESEDEDESVETAH